MKILKQITLILLICLFAEVLAMLLPINFPSSILAMVILAVMLISKVIKEEKVKDGAQALLELLPLFIVPNGVYVIEHLGLVSEIWFQLIIICITTLVLTFLSCVYTIRFVMKISKKMEKGR